jgi:glycosyltransferase involved in cell wall biosynthesis
MRILYHHRTGATDAQRVHILEIVRALRAQNHQVEFASLVDPEAAPATPDSRAPSGLHRLLSKLKSNIYIYDLLQLAYNVYAVPKIIRHSKRFSAQGIYERHALFNVAGVVAARLLKLPVVVEVNSPLAMEQSRDNKIGFKWLGLKLETWCLNQATQVLAVTTPLKDILVDMGVQAERITVMPNGIDPAHFSSHAQPNAQLAQHLGLQNRVVVGFVGWFREWHGIDKLVSSVAQAAAQNPALALLLIGDGPARPVLEAQIKALGVADRVKITGAVPHTKIPDYLGLVDIAAQPAANEYCCPMKVIEYMGMGKAIIAPNQPNLSELISDGIDGLLFQPGNVDDLTRAVARLGQDADMRKRLGAAASAAIETRGLLWSSNAARVVKMLEAAKA